MSRRRLRTLLFEPPGTAPLLPVQALHSAGESLFAVSLAGSLFFSVSVDAARPRILLYLALTMAPFVILSPLIGPLLDRIRGGHRIVLATSLIIRSGVALMLATQLKTLLLYPLAFVVVVLAKVYAASRNALVPSVVSDTRSLVVINSRIARIGTIGGTIGGLIGVWILSRFDASAVLMTGAVSYFLGGIATWWISADRSQPHVAAIVADELNTRSLTRAWRAMATLRAATGFAFFHLGFTLKTSGQPIWVIGAVGAAAPLGGFLGTFVAPRLRRHWDEQHLLTMMVFLPAITAVTASLRFHGATAAALSFSLGLAGSIGRRAFDGVVQTEAPHSKRGRSYAILETRLEVGWVIGSIVAVVSRSADWVGLAILASALAAMWIYRSLEDRRATRFRNDPEDLPVRLLSTADALAVQGDYRQALAVAYTAVDLMGHRDADPASLRALRRQLRDGSHSDDAPADRTDRLLAQARQLVHHPH